MLTKYCRIISVVRIMKRIIYLTFFITCFWACSEKDNYMIDTNNSEDMSEFDNIESVIYNDSDQFSDVTTIRQGLVCDHASKIQYYKQGELRATIYLTEPQTIAKSEKTEDWGVFQFPGIMKVNENTLLVRWSMHLDEQESWGKNEEVKLTSRISLDNGKTWVEPNSAYDIPDRGETFCFLRRGGVDFYSNARGGVYCLISAISRSYRGIRWYGIL